MDWSKVKHFTEDEFACKCGCGYNGPHPQLVAALDMVREEFGKPISILSGCRCPKHNAETPGAVEDSAHVRGYAADLRCLDSGDRLDLLKILPKYFSRIGIYKSFIHVDCDPEKPRHVAWVG